MRVLVSGGPEADKAVLLLRRARILCDRARTLDAGGEYAGSGTCDVLVHFIIADEAVSIARGLRGDGIMTPLLLVSSHASARQRVRALDAGADDFLTAPYVTAELLARVRALGRRAPLLRPHLLPLGDLTLDCGRGMIQCGVDEFRLPARELLLLEQFALNPSQILPRDRLLQKVWGYDCEVTYNNLEVYISLLRKRLREAGSRLRIRAQRSVGYYMDGI
ncbi:response regulator transcription factor [Agathobaculum sp.]|uniref:response regulator transcription factor n=1 Tax=Agathobaculum sp. TaxID=2048138 RepID=UPI002A81A12E|nr:response regulator transcription factor [Agathobaculum sp.]MDY3619440.1 response regulator transcription factor [Agathobaculum sp.]